MQGSNQFFGSALKMMGVLQPSRAEQARVVDESNAASLVEVLDAQLVDRVFQHSQSLSAPALAHFIEALCHVSKAELLQSDPANRASGRPSDASARVFSLQKLVEVADVNMDVRGRVVWQSAWRVLSRHFCEIATSSRAPPSVSLFAVDSLRQLSLKFLGREERAGFEFQRLFLHPFELVLSHAADALICEFVARAQRLN